MELIDINNSPLFLMMHRIRVVINNFMAEQYNLSKQANNDEFVDFYEQFANENGFLIYNHIIRSYNDNERNFITINFESENTGDNSLVAEQKTANFKIIVYCYANTDDISLDQQEKSGDKCLKMLSVIERALDHHVNLFKFPKGIIRRINKVDGLELNNNIREDNSVVLITGELALKVEYNYLKLLEAGITFDSILNEMNNLVFLTTKNN